MIPTGCQIAAARKLCGMSREDLAAKSYVSLYTIGVWERSSAAVVQAKPALLSRAIEALAAEGVRFTPAGVELARPTTTTVIASEGAIA